MAIDLKLDTIMKLSLAKRLLILGAINLLIAGIFYQFLLVKKTEEIAKLDGELQELEVKLNESRIIARDIPLFEKQKADLEEKLKAAVSHLPNEKEIPDLIDSISQAGRDSGLKILLFKPLGEVPRGFYAEVPVSMKVEGEYEGIFEFSDKVSELPRIVNIGNMKISSDKKSLMSRTPLLSADFVVTTFRFIPGKGISKVQTR
jgi:type IV pilus assembly protein PilO